MNKNEKISKLKIIIDYQIKSLKNLFSNCKCIEYINFKKFYRNNINNMGYMFYKCSSLKELNLSNFNTNNVTNMISMFSGCSDQFQNKIKVQFKNIREEAFMEF